MCVCPVDVLVGWGDSLGGSRATARVCFGAGNARPTF